MNTGKKPKPVDPMTELKNIGASTLKLGQSVFGAVRNQVHQQLDPNTQLRRILTGKFDKCIKDGENQETARKLVLTKVEAVLDEVIVEINAAMEESESEESSEGGNGDE